ncbi:MAG: hypothetical protein HXS44_02165 [Theionarchaea archaeon]|nr:hypothetical protein [Theionarchaea archaeon]
MTYVCTTILTASRNLAVARTLRLEARAGSGKIFLDTTDTLFHKGWQSQLQTVFALVTKVFGPHFDHNFLVSIDSHAVDGWSTSVPLFLQFASVIKGEPLPDNIFSTGCMFSPDGWVSYGKFEAIQAKIDALEVYFPSKNIEKPTFLIPFSFHNYKNEKVTLHFITSVFHALEIALPKTFKEHKSRIEELSCITAQDPLSRALHHIPRTGPVFVMVSADSKGSYLKTSIGATPLIQEDTTGPVHLYYIREGTVLFKHSHKDVEKALVAAHKYEEVIDEIP